MYYQTDQQHGHGNGKWAVPVRVKVGLGRKYHANRAKTGSEI
jgi:hypothetical protein